MSKPPIKPTSELTDLAGELSSYLMVAPPCREEARTGITCIRREEDRPLTGKELQGRRAGAVVRAFDNYDDDRLCSACSAYWHATLYAHSAASHQANRGHDRSREGGEAMTPLDRVRDRVWDRRWARVRDRVWDRVRARVRVREGVRDRT
jgi:hypothetical protein